VRFELIGDGSLPQGGRGAIHLGAGYVCGTGDGDGGSGAWGELRASRFRIADPGVAEQVATMAYFARRSLPTQSIAINNHVLVIFVSQRIRRPRSESLRDCAL
jgi:hypothetical protein